jgi:hypothetical protein
VAHERTVPASPFTHRTTVRTTRPRTRWTARSAAGTYGCIVAALRDRRDLFSLWEIDGRSWRLGEQCVYVHIYIWLRVCHIHMWKLHDARRWGVVWFAKCNINGNGNDLPVVTNLNRTVSMCSMVLITIRLKQTWFNVIGYPLHY